MTFVPNTDVDPLNTSELDEITRNTLDALTATNGQQKNGQSLLPPLEPVIFVEASESTLNTGMETAKYRPINVPDFEDPSSNTRPSSSASKASPSKPSTASTSTAPTGPIIPLDTFPLEQKWIAPGRHFTGLDNLGNSCFMNSTLQVLVHTPPLLNIIWDKHSRDKCPITNGDEGYCFACGLKELAGQMLLTKSSRPQAPDKMFLNLRKIAPSFRRGRQEDAHEFLRFAIDALQNSAQRGRKNVPEKEAETSWVYRLFGGKFRSRVRCEECKNDSDTFETLLDLSVDVGKVETLEDALQKFSVEEKLEGKNKYNCEKCKKPVNARKKLTVDKAPQALCVHLKRFTPWGRKLTHNVKYPLKLSIQDVMSKNKMSPNYNLYGIIFHAGSTPNSGHYYAFVQNSTGKWTRMNDDDTDIFDRPPLDHKNAYMLFYMAEPSSLNDIVAKATATATPITPSNSYKVSGYTIPKAPVRFQSNPRPAPKRQIIKSDDEDMGSPVAGPSKETKSRLKSPRSDDEDDDAMNPSPSKKPRYDNDKKENGSAPIKSFGSIAAHSSKSQGGPTKLDLRNVSSEDEEEEDTQMSQPPETQVTSVSQATMTEEIDSQLPISRGHSPEPNPKKPKAWQMHDDDEDDPATPTRNTSPPASSLVDSSSNTSTKLSMDEEKEEPYFKPMTLGGADARQWLSGNSSSVLKSKNVNKTYRSNAKKEQRKAGQNPYGLMGISDSQNPRPSGGGVHNNATIGRKKTKRAGGI